VNRLGREPGLGRELRHADTVVVPPANPTGASMATIERVSAAAGNLRPGGRIASICMGPDVLAQLGLLEGRIATTH
jgi:transcriptional regulator GlxA family with amidase domain